MHLYDKHDGDPDDGADDHEPAHDHGPGGVSVVLVCHHFPLVQAQYQDALNEEENAGKRMLTPFPHIQPPTRGV